MRLIRTILVCSLFLTTASIAVGNDQVMTPADIVTACGTPNESWISFCNGYTQAIFDAYHREGEFICPPTGTSRADMAQALYLGVREAASSDGATAAAQALAVAFPC